MPPSVEPIELPPAFGIVVYVSRTADGQVRGRVGNLLDVDTTGATERDVFQNLVPRCKIILKEAIERGESQPLLDALLPMVDGEQRRFLPLHL